MRYTSEIEIMLPREEVIRKFSDPENQKYWQKGLLLREQLTGSPGEEGAQSRLKFKMGNRELEMIETVLTNNLPYEFHASYEAKGVDNRQENFFEETADNTTRWISHSEFHFSGFMKIIGKLMPGEFKKQSRQFMEDFKAFAEDGKKVT